jgi:hypothetical protein
MWGRIGGGGVKERDEEWGEKKNVKMKGGL